MVVKMIKTCEDNYRKKRNNHIYKNTRNSIKLLFKKLNQIKEKFLNEKLIRY